MAAHQPRQIDEIFAVTVDPERADEGPGAKPASHANERSPADPGHALDHSAESPEGVSDLPAPPVAR
jgi:hypothetical protein